MPLGLPPHVYPHLLILLPSPWSRGEPLPEAGRGGENALGVTQIHWDFESGVRRNVGKDEAL